MTASGSRRYLMRAVLCLTVGFTGLFGCGRLATAQSQATPVGGVPDRRRPCRCCDARSHFAAVRF